MFNQETVSQMVNQMETKIRERKSENVIFQEECKILLKILESSGVGKVYKDKMAWLVEFPETPKKLARYIEVYFKKIEIKIICGEYDRVSCSIDDLFNKLDVILKEI